MQSPDSSCEPSVTVGCTKQANSTQLSVEKGCRGLFRCFLGGPIVACGRENVSRATGWNGHGTYEYGWSLLPDCCDCRGDVGQVSKAKHEAHGLLVAARKRTPNLFARDVFSSTLLMGKFNLDPLWPSLVMWYTLWAAVFTQGPRSSTPSLRANSNVVAYGPFSRANLLRAQEVGLVCKMAVADEGFVSPVANLIDAIRSHLSKSYLSGVLYIHDDMLMDVARVLGHGTPGYLIDSEISTLTQFTVDELEHGDPSSTAWWRAWPSNMTFAAMHRVEADARARSYLGEDLRLRWGNLGRSDMTYVPFVLAPRFLHIASWMVDNGLFLEIALPNIFRFVLMNYTTTAARKTNERLCQRRRARCTVPCHYKSLRAAARKERGTQVKLLKALTRQRENSTDTPLVTLCDFYHPIKANILGPDWRTAFGNVVLHLDLPQHKNKPLASVSTRACHSQKVL